MANDVVKPVAGSYVPVLKDEKLSVRILVSGMNLISSFYSAVNKIIKFMAFFNHMCISRLIIQ